LQSLLDLPVDIAGILSVGIPEHQLNDDEMKCCSVSSNYRLLEAFCLESLLTGLLGCLVSQVPLDGLAFTPTRFLLILASAPNAALTGLVFGGGE
jgi:hypothetical protein